MENILAMVEGPGTAEITGFLQINHTLFQELLAKVLPGTFKKYRERNT